MYKIIKKILLMSTFLSAILLFNTISYAACASCNAGQHGGCTGSVIFKYQDATRDFVYCCDGQKALYYANHTFNWTTTRAAVCYREGERKATCPRCGTTKTESIAKPPHNYSSAWTYDSSGHWHRCSNYPNCSATSSYAGHSDNSPYDGLCDTCRYRMYYLATPPSSNGSFVYNARTQRGVNNGTGYYLDSNATAIDVGTYTCYAYLNSGYQWSDSGHRTGAWSNTWSITPAPVSVSWSGPFTFEVDGNTHYPAASCSGVGGETISLEIRYPQSVLGTYTATAVPTVTSGQRKTSNYSFSNTTHSFELIDTHDPTATSTISPGVWSNSTVSVTVSTHDRWSGGTGSGVVSITEQGGSTFSGTSHVFTYDTEQESVHTYYCTDAAGNTSATTSQTVRIDKTLPSMSIAKSPNNDEYVNGTKVFTITVQDTRSGLKTVEYKYNDTGWTSLQNYSAINDTGPRDQKVETLGITVEQDRTIQFRVIDYAGNITTSGTYIVQIDKSNPTISVVRTIPGEFEDEWTNDRVIFDIACTDTWSGVRNIQYKRNVDSDWVDIQGFAKNFDNEPRSVTTQIVFTAEQNTIVQFRVYDWIGEGEVLYAYSPNFNIRIDKTPPTISVDHEVKYWINQDVTVTINAWDNGGGAQAGVTYTSGHFTWDGRNMNTHTDVTVSGTSKKHVIATINQPTNIRNGVAKVYDRAGNYVTATYTILNIDKVPPQITLNTPGDERYQKFTIWDPDEDPNKVPYGQSLLYGFCGTTSNSITPAPGADNTPGPNWVGTILNDRWFRMPNEDLGNPRTTSRADIQFFFPQSGTYYMKVRDIAGNITVLPVTITLRTPSNWQVTVTGDFIYDGTPREATVTVTDPGKNNKELRVNEDYKLEYRNNINVGTATVKIIGIGDYVGEIERTYEIKKRDLVVTPNKGQEKMTGVNDPVFTYSVANYVEGEVPVFTGQLSRDAGETPGEYKITLGTLTLSSAGRFIGNNYKIVFNNPYSYDPEALPVPTIRPDKDEVIKFKISDYDGMTTTWQVPANTTIKLPIPKNVENDYKVSWGDGTYNTYTIQDFPSHTYTNANTYTVRIAGTVRSFGYYGDEMPTASNAYSNYVTFNNYLKTIVKYGNINVLRMGFSYCKNLSGTLPEITGFEKVTTIENMFNKCTSLTSIPTGYFKDYEKFTSARNVFNGCYNIIGNFDATLFKNDINIKSFENAFNGCVKLTGSIPENMFDTNINAATFAGTFKGCTGITGALNENIFANNTNVQSFSETFANCSNISEIPENLFNYSEHATNFYRTFYACTSLTTIPVDLFKLDTIGRISNVAASHNDYNGTFENCTGITGTLTFNNVLIGRAMFKGCNNYETLYLPRGGEVGVEGFYGNQKLKNIFISNDNFREIGQDGFEYLSSPDKLTFINRNNVVLASYNWPSDHRRLDNEPPTGTVIVKSSIEQNNVDPYTFTKTENVVLTITVEDDYSSPENCKIAIINDYDYEQYVVMNRDLVEEYAQQQALLGDDAADPSDEVFTFDWKPYSANKDWTVSTGDGVKTVYVYFMDEAGNISYVSNDF